MKPKFLFSCPCLNMFYTPIWYLPLANTQTAKELLHIIYWCYLGIVATIVFSTAASKKLGQQRHRISGLVYFTNIIP